MILLMLKMTWLNALEKTKLCLALCQLITVAALQLNVELDLSFWAQTQSVMVSIKSAKSILCNKI